MARLPTWRDVAAEHLAPGRLNAVLSLSSHPQALLISCLFIQEFFNHSIQVRGLIRPKFILLGDGAIVLGDSRAPVPWHVRVDLDVENTSALVCYYTLAKRKGWESWKYHIKDVLLI